MNLDFTPERQIDRWHWPRFTKGCWGKPGVSKCWVCRLRFCWWHLKGLL